MQAPGVEMRQLEPSQQAPLMHGLAPQLVPSPWYVPEAAQAACVVTLQLVPEQQAPVGAHGSGLQLVPFPR